MQKSEPLDEKSSPEIDPVQSKKCYICLKGFNFRKKIFCKFCNNSTCADHCSRTKIKENSEEPQPICDLCYQDQIRKDIEYEINVDIKCLEEELKQASQTNNRLEREHFEKTANLSRLENELDEITSKYEAEIQKIERNLAGEELQAEGISSLFTSTQKKLEEAKNEENNNYEKLEKTKNELKNLEKQSEILKETREGLNSQLEKINEKLKGSLSIEQVSSIVCPMCATKIMENSKNRNEAPSILEDATISLNVDERQSIIESVREFKEILAHQNANPNEKNGCSVF